MQSLKVSSYGLKSAQKFELTIRQKDEELRLVTALIEQREDFQMLTRLNNENKDLKSQLNKARVKESNMRKIIEEYKGKGSFNRAKS